MKKVQKISSKKKAKQKLKKSLAQQKRVESHREFVLDLYMSGQIDECEYLLMM